MRRHVVITGMGLLSPLGNTLSDTWRALLEGTSGIAPGSFHSACASIPFTCAGEVRRFDPRAYGIKPKSLKVMNATIQYALAAASLALQDARLTKSDYRPQEVGIMLGVDGIQYCAEEFLLASYEAVGNDMAGYISDAGPGARAPIHVTDPAMAVHPLWPLSVLANMALCHIAIEHDFRGPNLAFSSLDAGGSQAIGEAFHAVRDGSAEVCLAGGSCGLNTMHLLSFSSLGLLARDSAACRPYDPASSGCLLGEGAAVLLIEELSRARRRGATVYAEIAGYSSWFDRGRPAIWPGAAADAPSHDMAECINRACADAGITAAEIDCIHAGGCGIPARDEREISALGALFGGRATPVTTSAALTGNMLASAGAFTAATAALSLHARTIVPAHVSPPASAGLTWNPHPVEQDIRYALANTFGMTGEHTAIVLQNIPAAEDMGAP